MLESQYLPDNDTIHHSHYDEERRSSSDISRSSRRKCSVKKMLLKILQISECLKACNFISKKLQHCEIFKIACSEEHLRTTASIYLKSKLQIRQFSHKPKTFNFRIYKVFSYLFSFANFSSTKFIFAFASFSLKMYIVSAKTLFFYVCMFCFLYALLSCLHT